MEVLKEMIKEKRKMRYKRYTGILFSEVRRLWGWPGGVVCCTHSLWSVIEQRATGGKEVPLSIFTPLHCFRARHDTRSRKE